MAQLGRFAFAALVVVGLAALPAGAAVKGQKKGGGGAHSMTGCLQKGESATIFKLTNVEGKGPKEVEIVETASGVDLTPHVGHKVTITGTALSARGAAKAEGTTGKKEAKTERREHHMKVDAVKMVSTTCP